MIVVPTNNPYLADLEENDEIDLEQFEMMETAAYRKKIIDLFEIQCIMKNMTKSGTHDNDPFNFVEVAMRNSMDLYLLPFIIFSQDVRNIWILILFSNQQWMID